MECSKCGSVWKEQEGKHYFMCPFCHEPLVTPSKEMDNLQSILHNLTSLYGKEILNDKQGVMQYLEICMPSGKREQNFLRMAYSGGIVGLLLKTSRNEQKNQKSIINQSVALLEEDYGISNEWANYIVESIAISIGLEIEQSTSVVGLRLQAEQGNSDAQYRLALKFFDDGEKESNIKQYLFWIEKSALSGNQDAKFHIGKYFFENEDKLLAKKNAITYLEEAADSGNLDAVCYLASQINCGKVDNRHVDILVAEIEQKIDLLTSKQLLDLSKYYENRKTDVDRVNRVLECVQLAYKKDKITTWKRYTNILEKIGDRECLAIRTRVLKEIVNEGNAEAIFLLAEQYFRDVHNTADMKTVIYWYKMAADAGVLDAQLRLADIYEKGKWISANNEEAVYWYGQAAINGSTLAMEKIRFSSNKCIRKTVTLLLEDDSEIECPVKGYLSYKGNEYLIIFDSEIGEEIALRYFETNSIGDFEVEGIDESEEKIVLREYRRRS